MPLDAGAAMVVPFGVSAGDFIAGINLFKDAIKSLSDVHGARADYMELMQTLNALNIALDAVNQFESAVHKAAVECVLQGCRECITDFLAEVAKFELLRKKSVTVKRLKSGLRRVQWSLCKKEDILQFKGHLETHLSALQLLLLTFQMLVLHKSPSKSRFKESG